MENLGGPILKQSQSRAVESSARQPLWQVEDSAVSFWEYKLLLSTATWRIIPASKWLVTPMYKAFRPFRRNKTS